MGLERFRLEQRIAGLKESFVNNRCPVAAKATCGNRKSVDRRVPQSGGFHPDEVVCQPWTKELERSLLDPIHQSIKLNT